MARKRKKGSQNRQNAAGNSRVSVLTEDKDTYNPFENIKSVDVEKLKTPKKTNKAKNISRKEDIVEKLDDDVSFADILEQWEKGGVVTSSKAKKSSKKEESKEDFAKIFQQWETQQGIRPKYSKKAKDNPDRKVSKYKPTKDFGQLLDQFEKGPLPNNKKINDSKKVVKDNIAGKKVQKRTPKNIEEPKQTLNNSKTEKSSVSENEDKAGEKSNIAWSAKKKVQKVSQKNEKKEDTVEIETKNNSVKSELKNVKTVTPLVKEKSNSGIHQKKEKLTSNSRWDFSDIYGIWEAKHNEAEIIEAKKQKEKKECKGISISYLRSMKPEAELDLHGLTSDIAALKVNEFLVSSRNKGLKKVSIITGKGLHSENGKAILKDVTLEEIRFSNIVREAYHPKPAYGGNGVIWVIFKSITDKKIYY